MKLIIHFGILFYFKWIIHGGTEKVIIFLYWLCQILMWQIKFSQSIDDRTEIIVKKAVRDKIAKQKTN